MTGHRIRLPRRAQVAAQCTTRDQTAMMGIFNVFQMQALQEASATQDRIKRAMEDRMIDEVEEVALAMFVAENEIDGNEIIGWEDQPPIYKDRMRAMARAAILQIRVMALDR